MRSLSRFLTILTILTSLYSSSAVGTSPENSYTIKELGIFSAVMGRTIGVDKGYGTIGYFGVIRGPDSAFNRFLDLEVSYFEHSAWAASVGLGNRWIDPYMGRLWGAYVFYDYRAFDPGNFNQIGVGIETVGSCLDFRINGYLPVGKKEKLVDTQMFCTDDGSNYFAISRAFRMAFAGADAEIGLHLWECGSWELYLAGGGYYLHHADAVNVWGGRGRVSLSWTEYCTLEAEITHDQFFKTRAQGAVTLTIPFMDFFKSTTNDCAPCCPEPACDNLLLTLPYRNDMIVTGTRCCWESNF